MGFGKKAGAAIMAGLMATSAIMPVSVAFAENTPSAGSQTGSGSMSLRMITRDALEHGGTVDSTNPDGDNDGLGDTLAFTVPSVINYVVNADGSLIGPSEGAAYIENKSVFNVNVSSADVDATDGFTFVADATQSSAANSVDMQFGPAADMLQASDYMTKTNVTNPAEWAMAASGNGDASKVLLKTQGDVAHLNKDVTSLTKFGEVRWYLKATSDSNTNFTSSNKLMASSGFKTALSSLVLESGSRFDKDDVQQVVVAKGTPDTANGVLVSDSDGSCPVYATVNADGTILTLTSEADKVLLNENSSSLFAKWGLTSIDMSQFDTSLVTTFENMFQRNSSLTTVDFSGCDLSSLTNMSRMFVECEALTTVDFSGCDTSHVTDMSGMFTACTALSSFDASDFNTSSVTNMSGMFSTCTGFASLDLSSFDTSNVTNMGAMFAGCTSLSSLNVANWNTSKVTSTQQLFERCGLSEIDISGWDVSSLTNMNGMFINCPSLTRVVLPFVWNTHNVTDMSNAFRDDGVLTLDCSGWDVSSVTTYGDFNRNASGVTPPVWQN